MKQNFRYAGAVLAATVLVAPVVTAPGASAVVNPASCMNSSAGSARVTTWKSGSGWGANIYSDPAMSTARGDIRAVRISFPPHVELEDPGARFPDMDTYQFRTNPGNAYAPVPGYGGTDSNGRPTLFVYLPSAYVDHSVPLQITKDDPADSLPLQARTATSEVVADLFDDPPAEVSFALRYELGETTHAMRTHLQEGDFGYGTKYVGPDGEVHFENLTPCAEMTFSFDDPPKFSKFLPTKPITFAAPRPGETSDLGEHLVEYERGSLRFTVKETDGSPAAGKSVTVETPNGTLSRTAGANGVVTIPNARPGSYTIASTGTAGEALRKTVFLKPGENRTETATFVRPAATSAQSTATVTYTTNAATTVTGAPRTSTVTEAYSTTIGAPTVSTTVTEPAVTEMLQPATVTVTTAPMTAETIALSGLATTVTPVPVIRTLSPSEVTVTDMQQETATKTSTVLVSGQTREATVTRTVVATAARPVVTAVVEATQTSTSHRPVTTTARHLTTSKATSTARATETVVVDSTGTPVLTAVALAIAAASLGGAVATALGRVPAVANVQHLVASIGGK